MDDLDILGGLRDDPSKAFVGEKNPVSFLTGKPKLSFFAERAGDESAELMYWQAKQAPSQIGVFEERIKTESIDAPGDPFVDDALSFANFTKIQKQPRLIVELWQGSFRGEGYAKKNDDREAHEDPVSRGVESNERCGDGAEKGKQIQSDVDESQVERASLVLLPREKLVDPLVEKAKTEEGGKECDDTKEEVSSPAFVKGAKSLASRFEKGRS